MKLSAGSPARGAAKPRLIAIERLTVAVSMGGEAVPPAAFTLDKGNGRCYPSDGFKVAFGQILHEKIPL